MNLEQLQKKLGENVKRIRLAKDMTQDSMRDHGFNYRYFQEIEAGKVNATLDTLVRLAKAFKCKATDLIK